MSANQTANPSILIVDDDTMLLNLLQLVLRQRGFVVYSASSGEEALALYRHHHASTELALLDVCMPGLDGVGTLAELRRVQPGLRACFMSGHTGLYGPDELRASGMLRFFDKPFSIHQLADELWQLAHEGVRQTA
jgi:DNA-binding NtrC family response regulator